MNEGKIEDLLLRLIEDVAFIKSKLESIEDQKLGSRIDALEAQSEKHERQLKSIEHRCDTVEQFLRNNMQDSKKQMTSIWVSMGLAIFSVALNVVVNLF